MMSSGRTPTSDPPFGYTFPPSQDSNPYNAPFVNPPGPPLLDNNESDLLKNFFENPNNVDPSILSLPNDYQNDSGYDNMNFDWTNSGSQNFMNTTPGQRYNDTTGFSSRNGQQGGGQPSDDVYAAAQLLHNNQIRHSGQYSQGGNQSHPTAMQGVVGSSGYEYQNSVPAYDFQNNAMMNGFYNGMGSGYNPDAPRNAFMQGMPGVVNGWGGDSSGPLRFGSDENFRSSTYIPTSHEAPDKELTETVTQHLRYNLELQTNNHTQPSSPEGSPRKRNRNSLIGPKSEYSEAESQSSDEDSHGKKRRRSKIKTNDDDDFSSRNRRKSGQKGSSSTPTSKSRKHSTVGSSKSKRSKDLQAESSSKPARENLTEEQKRSNHIQSEQKRRNLIKQGFDDLNELVPDLRSGGFSKSNMLLEVARFMRQMQQENDELRAFMKSLDSG